MNRQVKIRQVLLEEGLEDLISLPEAAETCRSEGLIVDEDDLSLGAVIEVLVDLFRTKKIQVWAGPPIENEDWSGILKWKACCVSPPGIDGQVVSIGSAACIA